MRPYLEENERLFGIAIEDLLTVNGKRLQPLERVSQGQRGVARGAGVCHGEEEMTRLLSRLLQAAASPEVSQESQANLSACLQCRSARRGCPVAGWADIKPHALVRLAQLGLKDELLGSRMIWSAPRARPASPAARSRWTSRRSTMRFAA